MMQTRILPTTRALRVSVGTDAAPVLPVTGGSLQEAEQVLARSRQMTREGKDHTIRAWLDRRRILSFEGEAADTAAVLARVFNRIRATGWTVVDVAEDRSVYDPGPARRAARRYLGLRDSEEALPAGHAAALARKVGWGEGYVSNVLKGNRPLTESMREKLAKRGDL